MSMAKRKTSLIVALSTFGILIAGGITYVASSSTDASLPSKHHGFEIFGTTENLRIHTRPALSAQVIGTLAPNQVFYIACQTLGTNEFGNRWWDQLTTGGYISDYWTNTPGQGPPKSGIQKCASRSVVGLPTQPQMVSTGDVGTTTALISWREPDSNGGAKIDYYGVSGGSGCHALGQSCNITGLLTNSTTMVCVRAHNSVGFGPAACASVTTSQGSSALGAPVSVTNFNVKATTASISWGSPSSNGGAIIDFYQVSGGSGCEVPGVTCNITGLPPQTSTMVCVRAHNNEGYGPSACTTVTTRKGIFVPSAPTSVVGSNVGTTAATISWGAPSSNGGSPVDAYLVSGGSGCQVTGRSCIISGLPSNAMTQICVRARNSAGYGPAACTHLQTPRPQYGPYVVTGATIPVNIRSGPGTNYPIIGTLAPGQTFYTYCQASGTSVNGNVWWDLLTSGGYFSDWWTNTPGQGPPASGIPTC